MDQIAGLRAQWLAQITEAIESAQHLAWQLRTRERVSAQARELYDRLEAAKIELRSMRETERLMGRGTPDWLVDLGRSFVPSDSDS